MKLIIDTYMKKSNEYLYGEDIEVPELPQEFVMRRVELLNEHLTELLEVHYDSRDGKRCNDVMKAIDFWSSINDKH